MNDDRPTISVVVPTCGRPHSLRRLLRALALQDVEVPFEVVVVVDGASAESAWVDPHQQWPYPVLVVTQPPSGPAGARNRGVTASRGSLLLFLDDDVEPEPQVLKAHLSFHRSNGSAIGAGDLEPSATEGGFVGMALAGWWDVMCDGLRDPRHRFTFRDLLTGHCSMTRATFDGVGGFDTFLRCHEDFEFGYRAIGHGIDLRFVAGAAARHHDESTLDKILRRKFDEGIADVQLVRKHPLMLRALPLGRSLADSRLAAVAHEAVMRGPHIGTTAGNTFRSAMGLFERLSMRDKWRSALERAMDCWYWRGAVQEAGGADAVRALRAREDPAPASPLVLDIAGGLELAERVLDAERPATLRVLLDGEFVCELAELPGAEPLRGVHLRPLLLKGFPREFAIACARAGRLPAPFLRCAQPADTQATSNSGSRSAHAA
jgi:GT2 family glycosyltransferase